MRELDWSATPLGPVEQAASSANLRAHYAGLGLSDEHLLGARLRIFIQRRVCEAGWNKAPWALGRRVFDVFPEVRHSIGPLFEGVMRTLEGRLA